jgi:SAM-dependent methyltransferase
VKERFKHLVMRLMRPGVAGLEQRVEALANQLALMENVLERQAGVTLDRDKYREELAYWRWLIKTDQGRASLPAPFEQVFGGWQRDRLRELGRCLGLDGADPDSALDAWCRKQSVVEIGAGPYPAVAAAPAWRRAVAVDPIARGYAEEGLLPAAATHITYLEAPGERVPLPSGFADLLIIENALDHVSDPGAVLTEIFRLLRPGGLLWLLVDLSTYSDHMHPHPFDEGRVKGLLAGAGFTAINERVSDHKSHPKAYGEYRGLLRKPGGDPAPVATRPAAATV